ncbi:MAG: pyrimidine dimer DNA glycosylase/endonuclease V [Syntrophales bacterium]
MRLWSLHPQYLDPKGLVALWREGLLAQAVLVGKTIGYKHHPQLVRFLESSTPTKYIAAYLRLIHDEAVRRGYHFDEKKIDRGSTLKPLLVTRGQLEYEWSHLNNKLKARAPSWLRHFEAVREPEPHPLFQVVAGGISPWELIAAQSDSPRGGHSPHTTRPGILEC